MTTTVSPEEFRFVSFDAEQIRNVADGLLAGLAMADRDVTVVVDETTPLGRINVEIGDGPMDTRPITIRVESGAFEDMRRPRQQSETAIATSLGRVLLRVRDRLEGGFGEAPQDEELTLAQVAAWEAYCLGRLERLGVTVNQQRWRYNFRNRHGFTDGSDAGFDRLWSSDRLTWGELDEISRTAAQAATATSG
jgi:hypothetical protein